jgi:hypothetical protein
MNMWAASGLTPRSINAGATSTASIEYATSIGTPRPRMSEVIAVIMSRTNKFPPERSIRMVERFIPRPVTVTMPAIRLARATMLITTSASLTPFTIASAIRTKVCLDRSATSITAMVATIPQNAARDGEAPCTASM